MIYGIGIDIVDISKFTGFVKRHENKLNRIFSESEILRWRHRNNSFLAATFAVKEAVIKTIGRISILTADLTEIELQMKTGNKFIIKLNGNIASFCSSIGICDFKIGIAFNDNIAMASVIALTNIDD